MSDMVHIAPCLLEQNFRKTNVDALGAVRLEHQFYALGQACANACHIALGQDIPIQDVPYPQLQAILLEQGVVIDVTRVGSPKFPDE